MWVGYLTQFRYKVNYCVPHYYIHAIVTRFQRGGGPRDFQNYVGFSLSGRWPGTGLFRGIRPGLTFNEIAIEVGLNVWHKEKPITITLWGLVCAASESNTGKEQHRWKNILKAILTLPLPSSKSTFSQPFKEKCTSDVVRIGSIITFHQSKLWKAKFFILCGVIFLVRLRGNLKLITLGSERVQLEVVKASCSCVWHTVEVPTPNGIRETFENVPASEQQWVRQIRFRDQQPKVTILMCQRTTRTEDSLFSRLWLPVKHVNACAVIAMSVNRKRRTPQHLYPEVEIATWESAMRLKIRLFHLHVLLCSCLSLKARTVFTVVSTSGGPKSALRSTHLRFGFWRPTSVNWRLSG